MTCLPIVHRITSWNLEPTKAGKLPVAKDRGGPLNIYYQVHGHGPTKLVLVMGLGGLHVCLGVYDSID